jgi:O-antigen ligase
VFKWFGILCLLTSILQMLRTGSCPPFSRRIPSGWYLLYFVIAVGSCLLHDGVSAFGQSPFMSTISAFSLFIITVTMVGDSNRLRWTVLVALGSVAWGSLYVIRQWQQFHSVYAGFRTWGGLSEDPNYYSVTVVIWLPLVLAWLMGKRPRWEKWFCIASIVVMLMGFMFAASRGGFLGLLGALLFLIWNSRNRLRNFAIVAILMLPLFIGPGQSAFHRLINPSQGDEESSNYRLELWKAAEDSFLQHPFSGVGMGHYNPTINKNGVVIELPFHVAHNTYVGLTAEMGLVGTIPFLGILIGSLLNLRRVERRATATGQLRVRQVALGLQAGLIGYMICAFFLSMIWLQVMWFAVFLSMCLTRIERLKVTKVGKEEAPLVASVA